MYNSSIDKAMPRRFSAATNLKCSRARKKARASTRWTDAVDRKIDPSDFFRIVAAAIGAIEGYDS